MSKQFGLPYMGSKSKLATRILQYIPKAENFVDLFAGGCAITHAAMQSYKYKRVIANDISDIPQVFLKAMRGDYENEDRWISRDDFYKLKDTDPFVRLVWSFGNNLHDYMYSKEIEPFKRALHWAIIYKDPKPLLDDFGIDVSEAMSINNRQQRWLIVKRYIDKLKSNPIRLQSYLSSKTIKDLNRVAFESHERWNCINETRLQHIERIGRIRDILTITQGDYRDVAIPPNSVVYADPPYKGTRCYRKGETFDHDSFYDYLRNVDYPVWVSEYSMPNDFICIAQFHHRATNGATKGHSNNAVVERLFIHEKWEDKVKQKDTLF